MNERSGKHRVGLVVLSGALCAMFGAGLSAEASPGEDTFTTRSLTPETALVAARGALENCREAGHQVGVAVVDRAGLPQVFLRDRHAGAHTVEAALNKAWSAASFRVPTATLATETQAGKEMSGLRALPRTMAAGGGQVIEAAGSVIGAIGVSGASGGEADDACARAGLKAIAASIEF
jgi:uncharacterized protein GlcG (DUF336 family)